MSSSDTDEDDGDNADSQATPSRDDVKSDLGLTAEQASDDELEAAGLERDDPDAGLAEQWGIDERASIEEMGERIGQTVPADMYEVAEITGEDVCWVDRGSDSLRPIDAGYAEYDFNEEKTNDDGEVVSPAHTTIDTLLNADLRLDAVLRWPDDDTRADQLQIEVRPTAEYDDAETIQVSPSVFSTPRQFRENVLARTASVTFDGGQTEVNWLKKIVASQMRDVTVREIYDRVTVTRTGGDPRLVTPNGVLTPSGWAGEDAQAVWSEDARTSGMVEQWSLDPDGIEDNDVDADLAAQVAELIQQVRDPNHDRWMAFLGHTFASPFRQTLTGAARTRITKWPNIHVAGQTETGKSTAIHAAKATVGAGSGDELIDLGDAKPHAILSIVASTDVVPLTLDEYMPSKWSKGKEAEVHRKMKSASTGSATEKGRKDQGTNTYHIDAPLQTAGEERLTDEPASVASRSIELSFNDQPTKLGSDGYEAYETLAELRDDDGRRAEDHHAMLWWEYALDAMQDAVADRWEAVREWTRETLAERGLEYGEDIESDRVMQQASVVAFGLREFKRFCEDIGADAPTDSEIADAVQHATRNKVGEGSSVKNNLDNFIESLAAAARASQTVSARDPHEPLVTGWDEDASAPRGGSIPQTDGDEQYPGSAWQLVHETTDSKDTRLRIHVRSAVAAVSQYKQQHGMNPRDTPDKKTVKNWIEQAAQNPESYAEGIGINTGGRRHAGVYLPQVVDELDAELTDFRPEVAVKEEITSNDSDDQEDDDGEDGAGVEGSQAERVETVKTMVDALSDTGEKGADVEAVVAAVAAQCGCSEERLQRDIESLTQSGEMYEPVEGELRLISATSTPSDDEDDDSEDDEDGDSGSEDEDAGDDDSEDGVDADKDGDADAGDDDAEQEEQEQDDAEDDDEGGEVDVPTRSIPGADSGGDSDAE